MFTDLVKPKGTKIHKWTQLFLIKFLLTLSVTFLTLSVFNLLAWFVLGWARREVLLFIMLSLILGAIAGVLGALIPSKHKAVYVLIPAVIAVLCWFRAIVY